MRAFAALLDRLLYTRSRNAKLALIAQYLLSAPDPDRGWALAALTGELDLPAVQPSIIRTMMAQRLDPVLFELSYDYVGDLAETCALLWPEPNQHHVAEQPLLSDVVAKLAALTRAEAPNVLSNLLNDLDATARWACLKLATGGLRIGVSARLAKTAVAQAFSLFLDDIEEVWHGLQPPYADLFDWAEKRTDKPSLDLLPAFRPFMLAQPLEAGETLNPQEYVAEWKWDGIRVQVVRNADHVRVFSRTGDDISASFPEVAAAMIIDGVVDGELLVRDSTGEPASFNMLQQRLGRKRVTAKDLADYPAFVRLYDILLDGKEDVRTLTLLERKLRLNGFAARLPAERFDVSAVLDGNSFEDWEIRRAGARDLAQEGLMLKRKDSPYVGGRKAGLWYKWKRDPLVADCVLMYAQRGHGKRSSFYSDFTFGAWSADGALLPVGKAYFGFTDAELKWLDSWVRNHTVSKFGPVREVEKALVLEVAFDAVQSSARHKSGIAMRFPRISRIRSDKPAGEADTITTLQAFIAKTGK